MPFRKILGVGLGLRTCNDVHRDDHRTESRFVRAYDTPRLVGVAIAIDPFQVVYLYESGILELRTIDPKFVYWCVKLYKETVYQWKKHSRGLSGVLYT